jgi:tetratricopeptide (TPR) repeat protein
VHIDQAQYDKAIADFTASLQIDPENIDTLIERARAYDKKANRTAALNDLKRALALAKTSEDKARAQAEIDRLTQ